MCNQDNSFTLEKKNMANTHEESSEESSDRTSHENTSSSEEDLQNLEEPRTSTSSVTTHNSRKGKSK